MTWMNLFSWFRRTPVEHNWEVEYQKLLRKLRG